jgi:superfamily II DNA/RNA helicase
MNASNAPDEATKPFVFSSPEGYALCRHILKEHLPYDPHDVQIEGICKILDNVDLFAVLATGSGKTSFLSMYMLVVLAIQRDPSLCPTAKFPENPCLLVICPTKYLEHQMVSAFYLKAGQ